MVKIKFILNKYKNKKIYFLRTKTKFNKILDLGSYVSNIKLYILIYPKIISYSKLSIKFSKQFSLISLYYLKKFLNKKNI